MTHVRIGISGWRYPGWRNVFYPAGLPQRRELEYAAQHFDSIEINGSFYSLQRPEFYRSWYQDTPRGFVFSVKGPRFITHMKKLRGVRVAVANFFASGPLSLRDKLGPILWQFPEQFAFDPPRFEDFFDMLPRDTDAAAELARDHDRQLLGGHGETYRGVRRRLRYAVEVRSKSFRVPEFIDMLRRHKIALVVADTAHRWPYFEDVTANFMYLRLHGDVELYKSGYSAEAIERWAERIRAWRSGAEPADAVRVSSQPARKLQKRDVYAYFDNDVKVRAPFDASALARKLGVRRSSRATA